jgi:hypothetical protein
MAEEVFIESGAGVFRKAVIWAIPVSLYRQQFSRNSYQKSMDTCKQFFILHLLFSNDYYFRHTLLQTY